MVWAPPGHPNVHPSRQNSTCKRPCGSRCHDRSQKLKEGSAEGSCSPPQTPNNCRCFVMQTCPLPVAAKLRQSCLTLRDPVDGSPPGSPVPGLLQARTLEWVAISFLQCMQVKRESEVVQSCPTLSDPMDCSQPGFMDSPGKSTGVGCHCLLQLLVIQLR